MYSGFDFGTSNCAVGIMHEVTGNPKQVQLLPIDQGRSYMPSVLYALDRTLICEHVAQQLTGNKQSTFIQQRDTPLNQARQARRHADISHDEQALFFGHEGFEQYLSLPDEGYFVKSVKSFLGCSGLRQESIDFFEDIVTAMMLHIKKQAEHAAHAELSHTVIGRPVNFQGLNADESNARAIAILSASAKRAGFKSVEFLYEPLAAGLDFEAQLTHDKTVLVVDVGGGTTDCSMVNMGPSLRNDRDRSSAILGHSGERIGGNDLDIQFAGKVLMPLLGMHSVFKDGIGVPQQIFWDAVQTNNIGAQTIFNSKETGFRLAQYLVDSDDKALLSRFIKLREHKQNHQLVRSAEQAKIALSDRRDYNIDLNFIEHQLHCNTHRDEFAEAVVLPIRKIRSLIKDVVSQAGVNPDIIYITGGTAKSQIIRQAVEASLPGIAIVDGDHFGSVTKGLTVWAERIFS